MNLFENLCYFDPRNPNGNPVPDDDDDPRQMRELGCACDNCFSGRDRLATEALAYLEMVERLQKLFDMECLTHREDLKALAKAQHDLDRYRAHIDRMAMASHNVIACAKSEACACGNPACTETADAWAELDASCAAACEDIEPK